MHRLGLLILVVATSCTTTPKPHVPVHEEPLHRLVHEGEGFRVLDVQIPAGAVSLYHVHDAPITYVSIDPSPMDVQELGGAWRGTLPTADAPWERGEVAWTLDYAQAPLTHRVTNVGTSPFRLIAVLHHGPASAGASRPASTGTVEQECPWFRIARRTLAPGESVPWESTAKPEVAVLVSAGRVQAVTTADRQDAAGPGAFLVREADEPWELRNLGASPVELVFVEVR